MMRSWCPISYIRTITKTNTRSGQVFRCHIQQKFFDLERRPNAQIAIGSFLLLVFRGPYPLVTLLRYSDYTPTKFIIPKVEGGVDQ